MPKKRIIHSKNYVTSVIDGLSFALDGVISDWDSDGDQDIIYPSGNGAGILINDGDLHFKQITNFFFKNDNGSTIIRINDWDNDGDPDVLSYSLGEGADLKVWLNNMSDTNQKPSSPTAPLINSKWRRCYPAVAKINRRPFAATSIQLLHRQVNR
ncbi:MAG: VCBS repeat-containing protein [Bacteroidota bacterium]